jgi:hypothetical protein
MAGDRFRCCSALSVVVLRLVAGAAASDECVRSATYSCAEKVTVYGL